MTSALFLASALPLLDQFRDPVSLVEQVQNTPVLIFSVLEFCLAVAYLALWRAAPDYRVFRNMGLLFATISLEQVWIYSGGSKSNWALRSMIVFAVLVTAAEAMRVRNRRWLWFTLPIFLFVLIAGWFPSMVFVRDWPNIISEVCFWILIIQGFRYGDRRDRMIAAVFSGYCIIRLPLSATFVHLTGVSNIYTIGGWHWQYTGTALILMGASTLAIFARALMSDRREKLRLATEVEAARTVQQILIPYEVPSVPGFEIQSIYRPFGEVGGDFFQIIPIREGAHAGSVLIAIGDVSGKGMPAAMTVSLLVGTLRTLVHYTQNPGQILAAMNRRMIGRSNGGFTTCLVLRVDRDGALTAANAGHIAPYICGAEMVLENGLPLGLAEDCAYEERASAMAANEQLTLVTDGVVEARSASGELYGFERTAALSTEPAQKIAQAVQAFGQEDDITVLTLACSA
jgi:hypothetical protein